MLTPPRLSKGLLEGSDEVSALSVSVCPPITKYVPYAARAFHTTRGVFSPSISQDCDV